MHEEKKDAALGEQVPQEGMNRTLTGLTLLLTLPLMHLMGCSNPSKFKCDPISKADCDGGAGAAGGGTGAGGGGGEGSGGAGGGSSTLTVSAKKTLRPMNIDGRLTESAWDLSESISRLTFGTNNNTSTYGVLWDDTHLYVAVKVLDSDLQNDSELAWFDDSFEVYVDGEGERSASYDDNDLHLIKGWNDPALAAFPSKGATEVLHATADIPGGYTVEMAIPWRNFGTTPVAERLLGFDVQQNDDDIGADGGGGDREGTMSWNATQDTNFQSTAAFGLLRLSSESTGGGTGGSGGGSGGGPGGGLGGIAQTWQQVPLKTKAQHTAELAGPRIGGEGMQQIYDMEYAPSNANVAYFVTDTSQVWRTANGGASWQLKNNGFTANGGNCLAIDPNNENIVLVLGSRMDPGGDYPGSRKGLYRTTNGGDEWSLVYAFNASVIYSTTRGGTTIAFATSSTVYAGTHGNGLIKSTNGGANWSTVSIPQLNGDYVVDIRVHADDPTVLFVSSQTDNLLYKITNSGPAYTIGTGLPFRPISMALVGNDNGDSADDVIYAAVGVHGVYKSTNSGSSFVGINAGLANAISAGASANYISVSPVDPNYIYLSFSRVSYIYYSHNGGADWLSPTSMDTSSADGWVCGSLLGYDTGTWGNYYGNPVTASPLNRDIALIMADGDMIKKTTNGGAHWVYSSTGFTGGRAGARPYASNIDCFSWDPTNSNRWVQFLPDYGVFATTDGGGSYRHLRNPRHLGQKSTSAGSLDPTPNSKIIVTATGSWASQQIAITRNMDAVSPDWTMIADTDDYYTFIAFHPQNANICYAGRYKFTNMQTDNKYTTLQRKVIAMYSGDGDVVYATAPSGGNTTIYKSTDGGGSWLTPYPVIPAAGNDLGQITIDPKNQDKLYLAVHYRGIYIIDKGMLMLKNGANGLVTDQFNYLGTTYITIDPNDTNTMYAGYWAAWLGPSAGIFRSTNAGNTWTNINGNLGSHFTPYGLYVNPSNSYVYVGSSFGTWKLAPPGLKAR